jgi:hypothetical protein
MTKEAIIEIVGVALGVLCLAITIPMWLRIRRDMIEDFKKEQQNTGSGEEPV